MKRVGAGLTTKVLIVAISLAETTLSPTKAQVMAVRVVVARMTRGTFD